MNYGVVDGSTPPRQRRQLKNHSPHASNGSGVNKTAPTYRPSTTESNPTTTFTPVGELSPLSSSRRRLPFPVAVELHNIFPKAPRVLPAVPAVLAKKWFRPEHTTDLLYAVRLQIVVFCRQSNGGRDQLQQEQQQQPPAVRVLYAGLDSRRTQCPVWNHLHDAIPFADLAASEYESMRARFSVAADGSASGATAADDNQREQEQQQQFFWETPLHPSLLCRVASLPPDLPLNCVVVRYSDNSLRILPAHYQLLLDSRQGNIAPHAGGPTAINRSVASLDDSHRFDDSVFHALDSPAASPLTTTKTVITRDDLVRDAMNVFQDFASTRLLEQDDDETIVAASRPPLSDSSFVNDNMSDDYHFDDDDGVNDNDESPLRVHSPQHVNCAAPGSDSDDVDVDVDIVFDLSQLTLENVSLERLVLRDERALERERAELERGKVLLCALVDEIRVKREQNVDIEAAQRTQCANVLKVGFVLEAQRIRLVRELSTIYPITVEDELRFYIRGLEIPCAFYAGTVPDDVVSAALGFLCHLVHLLSKYLGVHLRYRLHCQSSRSAVQDERTATFPLFQGRSVEREQLEYGVHLLNMNVECICRTRGIRLSPELHILAKTSRIYENVIEGY